jgi:hypothetical protein
MIEKKIYRAYFPLGWLPARHEAAYTKVPIRMTVVVSRAAVEANPCPQHMVVGCMAFEWHHPITTALPLASTTRAIRICTSAYMSTSGHEDGARPRVHGMRNHALRIKWKIRWVASTTPMELRAKSGPPSPVLLIISRISSDAV